jgi:hypothetical protein
MPKLVKGQTYTVVHELEFVYLESADPALLANAEFTAGTLELTDADLDIKIELIDNGLALFIRTIDGSPRLCAIEDTDTDENGTKILEKINGGGRRKSRRRGNRKAKKTIKSRRSRR